MIKQQLEIDLGIVDSISVCIDYFFNQIIVAKPLNSKCVNEEPLINYLD